MHFMSLVLYYLQIHVQLHHGSLIASYTTATYTIGSWAKLSRELASNCNSIQSRPARIGKLCTILNSYTISRNIISGAEDTYFFTFICYFKKSAKPFIFCSHQVAKWIVTSFSSQTRIDSLNIEEKSSMSIIIRPVGKKVIAWCCTWGRIWNDKSIKFLIIKNYLSRLINWKNIEIASCIIDCKGMENCRK